MCARQSSRSRQRGPIPSTPRQRGRQRGLSLVELMVGIVVSLLVGLAASGSAIMFTASQRQGIGSGTTSVNASGVLNAIKADVSLAGLGFFDNSAALCTTLNLSIGATVVSNGSAFAPLRATRSGDHDQLDLLYSSIIEAGTSVQLENASDGTKADLRSLMPVSVGQAVLLSPQDAAGLCTVRSVTAVTASTNTDPQSIAFAVAGTHNAASFGSAPSYNAMSRATMLGAVSWNRYRVDASGNLLLERPATGASAILLRDVIAFRVQYGVAATATSNTLESWVDATGTFASVTDVNIERIRAVRIGVLTRSPQREKPDNAGVCQATTTAPTLFGTTPAAFASGDWQCFRYRTTTSVVPLRNFVI